VALIFVPLDLCLFGFYDKMVKIKREKLTQEIVRELIDYFPETGACIWKERDVKWFANPQVQKSWNKRCAGKPALMAKSGIGYLCGTIFNKKMYVHRLAWFWMTGEWPDQIDHINGIRDDNRWKNLRNVSILVNHKNQKARTNNTSGYKGVWFHKQLEKWAAEITINGINKKLGTFDTPELAFESYCAEAKIAGFTDRHIHGNGSNDN